MDETLYLGFTSTEPALDDVRVYERCEETLLGTPFTFRIIGASHYVSAPELSFHEVASCEELSGGTVHTYPLEPGIDEHLSFESAELRAETRVWTEPGSTLPETDPDVSYLFSEAAKTAILVGESGYETYHTYPEYDLTVLSETVLEGERQV